MKSKIKDLGTKCLGSSGQPGPFPPYKQLHVLFLTHYPSRPSCHFKDLYIYISAHNFIPFRPPHEFDAASCDNKIHTTTTLLAARNITKDKYEYHINGVHKMNDKLNLWKLAKVLTLIKHRSLSASSSSSGVFNLKRFSVSKIKLVVFSCTVGFSLLDFSTLGK